MCIAISVNPELSFSFISFVVISQFHSFNPCGNLHALVFIFRAISGSHKNDEKQTMETLENHKDRPNCKSRFQIARNKIPIRELKHK